MKIKIMLQKNENFEEIDKNNEQKRKYYQR